MDSGGRRGYVDGDRPTRGDGKMPKTLNEMESELQHLHKENFDLKMTIYYQKDLLERLKGGEMDLDDRQRELEEENTELAYLNQEKDGRIDELEKMLSRSRDGLDALKVEVKSASEHSNVVARERTSYEQKLYELDAALQVEKLEAERIMEERDVARGNIDVLNARLMKVEKGRASTDKQKEILEHRMSEAEREKEELRNKYEMEIAMLRGYRENAEKEKLQVSDVAEDLRSELQNMKKEKIELSNQLVDYEAHLRKLETEKDREILMREAALDRSGEDFRKAEAQIMNREHEIKELHYLLEEAQNNVKMMQREKEEIMRGSQDKERSIAEEIVDLQCRLQDAQSKLQEEKKAKEDVLLDMADIRQHGRQQTREMLEYMKDFDLHVDYAFASLFRVDSSSPSPLRRLQAEEQESSQSFTSSTTAGQTVIKQAQDLIRKWKSRLQVLPTINKQFNDQMAIAIKSCETRLLAMMERVHAYDSRLKIAECKIASTREGRSEAEYLHERELERIKRMLSKQHGEKLAQVTAEKLDLDTKLKAAHGENQDFQAVMQKQSQEILGLTRAKEEIQNKSWGLEQAVLRLKSEVEDWLQKYGQEAAAHQKLIKEKEAMMSEKKKLQSELERLMHQMHCREEIINVFTQTLQTHGLLEKEPAMVVALEELQQHLSQKVPIPAPAAGGLCAGATSNGGSEFQHLVRKTVEETALMMHQSKEETDHERSRLFEGSSSSGGAGAGVDAEKVKRRAGGQLIKHSEEVKSYVKEINGLVERAKEALERFEVLRQGPGAVSRHHGRLEDEVYSLLEANARMTHLLRGITLDLQQLYRRFMGKREHSRSPISRRPRGENDRNVGNQRLGAYIASSSSSPPPPQRLSTAAEDGKRGVGLREGSAAITSSGGYRESSAWRKEVGGGFYASPSRATGSHSSNYSYSPPSTRRGGGERGFHFSNNSYENSGGSGAGLREELLVSSNPRSSSAGRPLSRHRSSTTGAAMIASATTTTHHHHHHHPAPIIGSSTALVTTSHGGTNAKPIANLEKISHDLQQIAAKLEQYKSVGLPARQHLLLNQMR